MHKDKTHECFGNVKKLVTEDFKRAGYLKTEVTFIITHYYFTLFHIRDVEPDIHHRKPSCDRCLHKRKGILMDT